MSKLECNICGSDYADDYFKDKYTGEIVCINCILSDCETRSITHYTTTDGDYLGSSDDMEEVAESISNYTSYERIEEDKQ